MPSLTARIELAIGGRRVRFEIVVPKEPVTLEAMLPVFRGLTDVIVEVAAARVRAGGGVVSCRAGCGACCRQPVPIAPSEAAAVRALVEAMPEPRRSEMKRRFAAVRRRLEEEGLADWFERPPVADLAARREKALAYFGLGLACPFLVEESCSIHGERPIACREYLVTSPAAQCAAPSPGGVRLVELPGKVSNRVGAMDRRVGECGAGWVALALALEEPGPDATPPVRKPGPVWVEEFFRAREVDPSDGAR